MNIALTEFQETKSRIKAKEEREVAIVRERVLREIQPKFNEIEQMKKDALDKLSVDYGANRNLATEQYNAQLVALQQKFESDKRIISENAENKKSEILDATLQAETYMITKDCERAIADIDSLIAKRQEKE
jgi:hypothetical protein